jgi:uncharacterized membrane protein YjfL (UPF0719 family)
MLFDAAAALVLVTLALLVQRLLSGAAQRNLAQALVTAGHLVGAFLVVAAVVDGSATGDLAADALWTAAFGVTAVVLQAAAGALGTALILGAGLRQEIARGNPAAGVAAAGHYLATGVVVASCVTGHDLGTLGIALLFFAIAQVTLHLFVIAFRALTAYRDHEEILDENVAAALSYAGVTIALGVIIGHAADGAFAGWTASLKAYAISLAGSVALYPVRQLVVGVLLVGDRPRLRGGRLDEGIARGRDLGLGVLEAGAYVAVAVLLARLT